MITFSVNANDYGGRALVASAEGLLASAGLLGIYSARPAASARTLDKAYTQMLCEAREKLCVPPG